MRVLVIGADGYIGFPLSMHLASLGFEVTGVDNLLRRRWVAEVGSHSATPIGSMTERASEFERSFGRKLRFEYGDVRDYPFVEYLLEEYRPDAIVHLGEAASAPFSMIDVDHAVLTQTNNIVGTLNILHAMHRAVPHCHLVKLGSMGEYGSPNIDVPEGFFEIEYRGRRDTLPFPRRAFPDWYHWSKVYDSGNVMMASEIWGLRATDIMQGIVYGTRSDEMVSDRLLTRFDFDAVFGTALNRFCAQALIGSRLTVYGKGGQKRPFIALRDTINCIALVIQNPPAEGEYRVFNQFDEVYSLVELAQKVKRVGDELGLSVEIECIPNPRMEDDRLQYYNPLHEKLRQLGFEGAHTLDEELRIMLKDLSQYKHRIVEKQDSISPQVHWKDGIKGGPQPAASPIPV